MFEFDSAAHMIDTHAAMFGAAGRLCAELVLKWAPVLFAEPLNPLGYRIVLAPAELGPYNRHYAYTNGDAGLDGTGFILVNRHLCGLRQDTGEVTIHVPDQVLEDCLVHELTHSRQNILLQRGATGGSSGRGCHRDGGWYGAIAEACPRYLGFDFPAQRWPAYKSVRDGGRVYKVPRPGTLSEPVVCHWPEAMRGA